MKKQVANKKLKLNKRTKRSFRTNILSSENNKFLIHGITGSGKTEIYLQLVENMLEQGKSSIILVPEISLTPQTIERFQDVLEMILQLFIPDLQ